MELVRDWYVLLSRLSAAVVVPIGDLADRLQLAPASALLFGLIGAVAPCQLTTNASAVAYLGREGTRMAAVREAVAFVAGKSIVYSLLGGLALLLGLQLQRAMIPVALAGRRAIGPVLLVVGLSLLGVFRLRGGLGTRLAVRLSALAPHSGTTRAFLMGGTFALAFCPTLFWLFFGLTIPLGLASPVGFAFPALFAVGSSLPVLAAGGLLAAGTSPGARARLGAASRLFTRVAGVVFVVAGVNDTLTYWAL